MATSTFLCYLTVLELAVVSGHVALVVAQPAQSSMRESVKGRSEPPFPVKKKSNPIDRYSNRTLVSLHCVRSRCGGCEAKTAAEKDQSIDARLASVFRSSSEGRSTSPNKVPIVPHVQQVYTGKFRVMKGDESVWAVDGVDMMPASSLSPQHAKPR
jgi:hypothetical protein